MKATEFFTNNSDVAFEYVGTIYGNEGGQMTGAEIASMIATIDPDAEMIDHPAYGGRNGFYQQSGDVWYSGNLVEECVFKAD